MLPPSVNESNSEFSCVGETIRFGLSAVKNVGLGAVESILESRRREGKFKSISDFAERVDLRLCNRKVFESLIKCGAFDDFGVKRAQLMAMVDSVLVVGSKIQQDRQRGQMSLLDQLSDDQTGLNGSIALPDLEEWPENELLAYEREMLGFYVSAHPLAKYEHTLKTFASSTSARLNEYRDQTEVTIGGIVSSIKEITTKKGDRMAFVALEDLDGRCEIVVFPELYKASVELLQKDQCVFIRGKINRRDDVAKVIGEEVIPLDDVKKKQIKVISIDLLTAGLELDTLQKLKEVLVSHPGRTPVHLNFRDSRGRRIVLHSGEQYSVESDDTLFSALASLLGSDVIKIRC